MEMSDVIQLPTHSLRMLTSYDVDDLTGMGYRPALAFLKVYGEPTHGRFKFMISEAKLRKILEGKEWQEKF